MSHPFYYLHLYTTLPKKNLIKNLFNTNNIFKYFFSLNFYSAAINYKPQRIHLEGDKSISYSTIQFVSGCSYSNKSGIYTQVSEYTLHSDTAHSFVQRRKGKPSDYNSKTTRYSGKIELENFSAFSIQFDLPPHVSKSPKPKAKNVNEIYVVAPERRNNWWPMCINTNLEKKIYISSALNRQPSTTKFNSATTISKISP